MTGAGCRRKNRRKRFSEREVIATLIHQGCAIFCHRTKEPITLDTVKLLEREHLHERALGGPDVPGNCRYSLKAAHKIVTDGTKATTAGSSKNRIAKANNPNRTEKFVVKRTVLCFEGEEHELGRELVPAPNPKRKMQSKGFQPKPEGYKHRWSIR